MPGSSGCRETFVKCVCMCVLKREVINNNKLLLNYNINKYKKKKKEKRKEIYIKTILNIIFSSLLLLLYILLYICVCRILYYIIRKNEMIL